MNKDPIVSIIITSYNYGEYIDECLESVHTQTYKNIEIIIVDDGSNDSYSIKRLEELQKAGERVIRINNSGVSVARNVGVSNSNGEYIVFLDADDKLERTFIEKMIATKRKYEDVQIVYSLSRYFGDASKLRVLDMNPTYKKLLTRNCFGITCLLDRKRFEEINGFDEKMREGLEDWEFFIRYCYPGMKIARVNYSLFFYRIKKISRTMTVNASVKKNLKMRLRMIENNIDAYSDNINSLRKMTLYEENSYSAEYCLFKLSNTIKTMINFKMKSVHEFTL